MPNVSRINADNTLYDVKDAFMRSITPEAATTQNKLSTAADVAGENISGSATGTAITLTDSADGMVQGLTVYGRSNTSKNILDPLTLRAGDYNGTVPNIRISQDLSNRVYCNAGDTFTISSQNPTLTNGTLALFLGVTDITNTIIQPNVVQPGTLLLNSVTFSVATSGYLTPIFGCRIGANNNQNITVNECITANIQLERGSTATAYEPYGIHSVGDNGLTVTLSKTGEINRTAAFTTGLPLCSIPDTTIHDELNTGKEVVKQCGVLDLGDLTWTKHPDYNGFSAVISNLCQNSIVLCEKYDFGTTTFKWNDFDSIADKTINTTLELLYVYIKDTDYSDAATFKAAVTGVKLIYPLATPTTTPLTDAEISAFRQLRTFDSTTNINITDEPECTIDYLKNTDNGEAVSKVVDDLQGQLNTTYNEAEIQAQIIDRIYEGTDLTQKFATEIAVGYSSDPWAWIKARITAGNFTGIHVGDYIPFTTTNNVTLNAQIAGINTYKGYGSTAIGNHIDFICKELWATRHPVNKVSYNNGTKEQSNPWGASDLYCWLNSSLGDVPNEAMANPTTEEVDYTEDGVYYYLPTALKNVIVEKHFLIPDRYSASELLTDDNSSAWKNIGKLWLPDECEVCGMPVWSGKSGYSLSGSSLQYPLFAGNMNRLKYRNGKHNSWWLLSPYSGNSSDWCVVYPLGYCSYEDANNSGVAVPVCFRIA